jgi:tetratricopeptide (TPR) repeat protein
MQAYVYTDKSLERQAGRFVWLSINTEDATNADFLAKYRISALPTLLVLDAKGDGVLMRYVGGANAKQLGKMLDDARAKSAGAEDALLASADKLAAQGRQEEASKLYAQALDSAPKNWKRRTRTAESLVVALSLSGQTEECAKRAVALLPSTRGTVSGANIAATGLGCATELEKTDWIEPLRAASRAALDDAKLDISADDRSGIYISLIGAAKGDEEKQLKEEWASFLERSAAAAKTPQQRTVYDSHRVTAYMELGTPEKAIAMLEQSERDFPKDYNPPSRLALAYRAMKKYDDALAASDRALKLVYGPRKIVVLRARADIYVAMGDKAAAKKTIDEAIAYAKSLPQAQRSERTIAALEKRSAELTN